VAIERFEVKPAKRHRGDELHGTAMLEHGRGRKSDSSPAWECTLARLTGTQ